LQIVTTLTSERDRLQREIANKQQQIEAHQTVCDEIFFVICKFHFFVQTERETVVHEVIEVDNGNRSAADRAEHEQLTKQVNELQTKNDVRLMAYFYCKIMFHFCFNVQELRQRNYAALAAVHTAEQTSVQLLNDSKVGAWGFILSKNL
jgi:gamma-glutamylcyclotransferase (GGCT)/AIG2-like uncharacterized protein YtfP